MLSGHSIVCFSSIDWDFVWQTHQEIMTALAEHGNRVLFVDNTGIRPPGLADLPRLRHRLRNWWRGVSGFRQERENLFVYSPLLLPFPHSSPARAVNRVVLLRALHRWMRATHVQRPIVWTFLPTRLIVDLIDRLDSELVVYYCAADFERLTRRSRRIARSERMLLRRAHVVFAQGEEIRQHCLPHPNVHVSPPGVNTEVFERGDDVAPELARLKRPIIGFVGGIHHHVDVHLLERIAGSLEGTVVLVGPVQTDDARLRARDNVFFAGQQPHRRIPEFLRGFDVGIIPYVVNGYTRTVYPSKLNEYLVIGLPVVATDLPEIRRFNAVHGNVVAVAEGADAFVAAVQAAVDDRAPAAVERRLRAARENRWAVRLGRMSQVLEDTLSARSAIGERWEEALRRLYSRARRRIAQTAVAAVGVYMLLFYTPFIWLAAEPLRVTATHQRADAIVVFAGGVGESGKAGGGYQERVKHAVDLYRLDYASHLIFSSGFVFAFREADVMRRLAVSLGVPAEAIVLEERAGSTYENVALVVPLLEARGLRRILLVSSPYHMRRVLWTFRKVAPRIEVMPAPVPESQFYSHAQGASLEQIVGILHEYAAIGYYWWKGWA